MNNTLEYALPDNATPRSLWPAIVISLAGCPVASIATALLGSKQALSSGWLSPANFWDAVVLGLICGVFGGLIVAGFARAFRAHAVPVSIVGSLIVSGVSGISLFKLASMAGAG